MSRRLEGYMGNENKIKGDELVLRKREEFFKDTLVDTSSTDNLYSLAEEYAKTRKVRQLFLYLSVLVFIGSLVVGTLLMTMSIQRSSKRIPIGIKDFASVNLAELLTAAKKNEGLIRGLTSEIKELKRQRDVELGTIRDRLSARRRLLATMNISSSEKKNRSQLYYRQAAIQSSRVRATYSKKIQPKEQRLRELREQMAKSGKQLKKTQAALDNFQRLWEIEEKKLHNSYAKRIRDIKKAHARQMSAYKKFHKRYVASLILRYNPIFEKEDLKKIILETDGSQIIRFFPWKDLLKVERVTSRGEFDILRRKVNEELKLIARLQEVSYTNSVAPALKRVEILTKTVVSTYEVFWKNLLVTISSKNFLLKQFQDALDFYAKLNREHGYVISAKSRNAVVLVMNSDYPVTSGMKG